MKWTGLLAGVAMLASHAAFGQGALKFPCADKDKKCAYEVMKNHAAGKIDTWKAVLSRPAGERIGPAPPSLVEYITLDNIANGLSERPSAAALDAALIADVRAAVAELPPNLWSIFGKRLIGLYFVNDLGGTGFTDYVMDQNGQPVAAYVVFDAAVLAPKKANTWATWKENTPFKPDARYKLSARIEADSDDNRKNAIQYILLHELGHVLSVANPIHPPWNIHPREVDKHAVYAFFNLSWKVDRKRDRYQSIFDAAFPQRTRIAYYFGARLSAADMLPAYRNLKRTNFASLYAATSPGDDFAEAFATYVHVVMMKRPWQIEISRNGKLVHTVESCWEELRCAKKKEILDRLLKDAALQ